MASDQFEKYSYYVERLLLTPYTSEPTEYTPISHFPSFTPSLTPSLTPSFTPTQSIVLSTYTDINLQYIIAVSIVTSLFTTCCVICTGYYCSKLRTRLRLQYLGNISTSSHSSDSSSISSVSLSETNSEIELDTIVEKKEEDSDNVMLWFEDIYRRKMESYEGMV